MEIIQNTNFGTHNTSPRNGKIEYIAIHYVGATGDADDNVRYYNYRTTTGASADFFVGHAGDVHQYNPDPETRYTWAVGGRKQSNYGGTLYYDVSNKNSISIEMCVKTRGSKEANSPDWYFTDATVAATVELTKYLMDKYNVPAKNVIRHYDVNGKFCPGVVGWNAATGSENAGNAFKDKLTGEAPEISGAAVAVTVKEWQEAAIKDGFSFPKYGADGVWGAECSSVARTAVVKQRVVYLYPNLTRLVQRAVGAEIDGKCGPNTNARIRDYQNRNGLTVDGVVGINTWKKILGV